MISWKQWSVVWKHFDRKKKHSVSTVEKDSHITEERATFTVTWKIHTRVWPASDEDENTERTIVNTKCIDTYVGSDCSSTRSDAITNLVVDWISANSHPISIVEDIGLKQIFGYIEPAYSLPSCSYSSYFYMCHLAISFLVFLLTFTCLIVHINKESIQ